MAVDIVPSESRNYLDRFSRILPQYSGRQLYLIACAPKSGSTFAAEFLAAYLGTGKFFADKVPNRAVQDLDSTWINEEVRAGHTVIHQHCPYHPTTRAYIEAYQMRPVALVRDLADTIPSIRDQLRKVGNGSWPGAHIDRAILSRSDSDVEIAIAHLIMPWYFAFYAGWKESGHSIITYRDFIADPKILLGSLEIEIDDGSVRTALGAVRTRDTRFNSGRHGRGRGIAVEARTH